jgi:Endonuclease domain
MGMKNIVAINDEAHHCYREKPRDPDDESLKGDDRKEAEKNNEAARPWISGLEAVNRRLGFNRIVDLSATPFFLRGSGYAEGTLFPWTMTDYSLMDAIESGIVKLPRVPVAQNIPGDEMPMFRDLWENIRKDMPKKGRGQSEELDPLKLPTRLQTALEVLYGHYEKTFKLWEKNGSKVPPCFIIVCRIPPSQGWSTTSSRVFIGRTKMARSGSNTVVWHCSVTTMRALVIPFRDPTRYFGQLKRIAKQWLNTYLVCKGGTYPALLMYQELADMACNRITAAITRQFLGERPIKALLDPYNPTGSTRDVRFNSSRTDRWETSGPPPKDHINWVVLDSDWEGELCRVAESHPSVRAYTKNHNLGLEVPYRYGSETRKYLPDFIVLVDDEGSNDPLHLVVEIKGYRREDAKEKKSTMDTYWVPSVNHLKTYGRWAFAECHGANGGRKC